jgi:hypothetical protein
MKMKLALLLMFTVVVSASALAQCVERIGGSFPNTGSIQVSSGAFPWPSALNGAMQFWNDGCGNTLEFPQFEHAWGGTVPLKINYSIGHAPAANCGGAYCAAEYDYSARTITVYEQYGTDASQRMSNNSDEQLRLLLSHEFGHVLGLLEGTCQNGGIMSRPIPTSPFLTAEECADADAANYVPFEGTPNAGCTVQDCRMSPIIVDLDRSGIVLTGPDDGVWFDLDADGYPERTGWTAAGAAEAFLFVDWNENGVVDNGAELFGSAHADNGFDALRLLDRSFAGGIRFGGDDNGILDARDTVWGRLRLWTDANHDGVTQAGEVTSPADHGLAAIELAYKTSGRRDRHGNSFRYTSAAMLENGQRIKAIDVYFVVK